MRIEVFGDKRWKIGDIFYDGGVTTEAHNGVPKRTYNIKVGQMFRIKSTEIMKGRTRPVTVDRIERHGTIRVNGNTIAYGYELFPLGNIEEQYEL